MVKRATFLALTAILLWSFLAFLGTKLTQVPPLLLVGIALCVGGLTGLPQVRSWRVPLGTLAVGVGGLFGYHFLYFMAFRYAPAVEASLMNYLWPLLIVLLSPLFLAGYNLKPYHLIGAISGLAGAGLIVTGGRLSFDAANILGYIFAACAALVWASYSLMTKRLPPFSTGAVGAFCTISGLLSLGIFFSQPDSMQVVTSLTTTDWLYLALLGAGPMGLAFYAWDASLKRGDPRIIGALSYLTPLLSTLWLVFLAGRSLTWVSALAMILIVSGTVVGSLDLILGREK